MAMLQNLADELLSEILWYLAGDKALLCNVAIQSKRLSEIVRPILVRQVRLATSPRSRDPASKLLIRSIMESDLLASMVHDVTLGWGHGDATIQNINNKLLERLTRLRSLNIRAGADNPLWKHQYLKRNSLDFLTHLELHISCLTPSDVVKYIFLKSLKSMSISWMEEPKMPKLPKGISYGDSNLLSLRLESGFHLPEDALNEILKYPKSLKTLVTNLPGRDVPKLYLQPGSKVTTPLVPDAVTRALDPTRLSLVELSLVDEECEWPSQDRGRTDLSNFTVLKKLQISSRCYFLPGISARDSVAHLLPASLEEIEIVYDLRSGISPQPNQIGPTHGISNPSGEMTPDCDWLINLATAKTKGTLPALQKITLIERSWSKWSRSDLACMNADWNTPSMITRVFSDAGIQFKATARVKNTMPPQCSFWADNWGMNYQEQDHGDHEFHIIYQRDPPVSASQGETSS